MTTDSVTEAYVSRQPIYRSHMDLFGYELLFRDGEKDHAVIVDGDRATASVILNFFELGMERIVGKNRAFINLTRNFILDGHCVSLPSDRVVLEVHQFSAAKFCVLLQEAVWDERGGHH